MSWYNVVAALALSSIRPRLVNCLNDRAPWQALARSFYLCYLTPHLAG
jgi:hypothetical protein